MKFDKKYKFNETWFDHYIAVWDELFSKYNEEIVNVLEIGCYEGRATIYLCENVLKDGANYDVVDTFAGSEVESGMEEAISRLKDNPSTIYNNFIHNTSFFPKINFNIYKGISQYLLPDIEENNKKEYDLIYIDASHRGDDTFVDAYYAHKMLRKGGLLIFDDFGWVDKEQQDLIVTRPELGIKTFLTMYEHLYAKVHIGYQVMLVRI